MSVNEVARPTVQEHTRVARMGGGYPYAQRMSHDSRWGSFHRIRYLQAEERGSCCGQWAQWRVAVSREENRVEDAMHATRGGQGRRRRQRRRHATLRQQGAW